jgi:hypothetical protein
MRAATTCWERKQLVFPVSMHCCVHMHRNLRIKWVTDNSIRTSRHHLRLLTDLEKIWQARLRLYNEYL